MKRSAVLPMAVLILGLSGMALADDMAAPAGKSMAPAMESTPAPKMMMKKKMKKMKKAKAMKKDMMMKKDMSGMEATPMAK